MDPVSTFCLSAIVFLSLPLALFANAALDHCPSVRRSLTSLVWANVIVGATTGLLIIGTPFPPLVAAAIASAVFILCGMQMFQRVAILNNSMT